MTPERAKALEAVANAAQVWCDTPLSHNINEEQALVKALAALDALPAEPVGETVEVRGKVWQDRRDGRLFVASDGLWVPSHSGWGYIATITARIPRPIVPEVRAEVET